VAGKGGSNLLAFTRRIDAMREQTRGLTLREIIVHMLEASGLVDFYKTDREGKERLENLEELVNAAEAFVTQEGFGKDAVALPVDETGTSGLGLYRGEAGKAEFNLPGAEVVTSGEIIAPPRLVPDAETGEILSPLAAFLTHASLEAGDNQAQAGQDAVQLMTIHSAKGLEFDCVFISGLEEGLFPHENSSSDLDSLEEERRLMYVAITRARKRLYLSFSQTRMLHGQTRYNVKSRFVDELPEAALRWITPRNQSFGSGFAREYNRAWESGSGLRSIVGTGRVEPRYNVAPIVPKAPSHGLRPGQGVFHTKFGEGVVLTIEGGGDDARAQVNFGRHGMKWLALSVAKLTPVD
jgi:DNA helicase-2/ATP-dependent DNA helicase PcrA